MAIFVNNFRLFIYSNAHQFLSEFKFDNVSIEFVVYTQCFIDTLLVYKKFQKNIF